MFTKPLIMFFVGLLTGGGIGAGATSIYYNKKINDLIDDFEEDVAELEDEFRRKKKKKEVDEEEVNPRKRFSESADNGRDKGVLSYEERQKIKEKLNKNWEETTNYANMFDGGEPDDDEEDPTLFEEYGNGVAVDVEANEFHQKNRNKSPKIISSEAVGSLPAYLDRETFFFYSDVGILTDEENQEIPDPETYLGDSLTKYDFDTNDEKMMFVINYALDTIFEVQKMKGDPIEKR